MCCTIVSVDRQTKPANIGKPFPSVGFSVRSHDSLFKLPILGIGELCIHGPQVAREYHNNKTLTDQKFLWAGSERLYRTGDLVRMLGNGTFEFIGRTDDQVKIRGLRVELGEINSVLKTADSRIKDVCTVIIKHSADSKDQLISFLALEERKSHGTAPAVLAEYHDIIESARKAAERALPRYIVPGVILNIDHIPRSAAGKVDKKVLQLLYSQQDIESLVGMSAQGDEEWSKEETQVRSILAELSQVPLAKISRSSTIYELGLDSISASQVAMKMRKKGYSVSAIDILEVFSFLTP